MEVKHKVKNRKRGCPWGKRCDDCNLYQPLYMTTQGGDVIEEWDCTFNNLATLQGEMKQQTLGVQAAVESFRNNVEDTQKRLDQRGVRRKQIPVSIS